MGDTNIIIMRLEVVLLLRAFALVTAYYIKDEDAGGNPERILSEAEGMLLRERRDAEPKRDNARDARRNGDNWNKKSQKIIRKREKKEKREEEEMLSLKEPKDAKVERRTKSKNVRGRPKDLLRRLKVDLKTKASKKNQNKDLHHLKGPGENPLNQTRQHLTSVNKSEMVWNSKEMQKH